jgi:MSHA biogenesis protein MshL
VGGPLRLSTSLGFVPSQVQMISKLTPFQEQ